MKTHLLTALVVMVAATVFAADITDISKPAKPPRTFQHHAPVPRQGGDTIFDAVPISIPLIDQTGTTVGYNDDYAVMCPYGTTSLDVVYTFTPETSMGIDVDLWGSSYDTQTYIYDQNLDLVACNDDYHPDYTSYMEDVPLAANVQYFLVIDGYGGDTGEYLLNVTEHVPCVIDVIPGAPIEGEPEILDGYVDEFNGGCNSDPVVYSTLPDWGRYFGKLGYYLNAAGGSSRDLDWHEVHLGMSGSLDLWADAEEPMNFYEIEGDCDNLSIENGGVAGPCNEIMIVVEGEPYSTVRILCGPTRFWEGATYEFDYSLIIGDPGTAVEERAWSDVKALFE